MSKARCATFGLASLLLATAGYATPPSRLGGPLPEAYQQRTDSDPDAFTLGPALRQIEVIQDKRAAAAQGDADVDEPEEAEEAVGTLISGERFLPVIPVLFKGMTEDQVPHITELQKALFDETTGTLTDYYKEVSYGRFRVTGRVFPWVTLSQEDKVYEGGDFKKKKAQFTCNGLCKGARIGELLKEALKLSDPYIDFSQIDLTGRNGEPDGFVDAVAFVLPEMGAECGADATQRNIWSHQGTYTDLMNEPYTTDDTRNDTNDGQRIRVNMFLVVSALDCERPGVSRIGVLAHEFGHTLGLPDLYDTDPDDGTSDGVGNWCLMGTGTWGGDGHSPEKPVHLSAWAKERLGWIFPDEVKNEPRYQPASLNAAETAPLAYKLRISRKEYYLVENRQKVGYDERLPGAGLLIWKINQSTVKSGLQSNRVNADETNKGVSLEQADGKNELDKVRDPDKKGDIGDVFRGSSDNHQFHNGSTPASHLTTAVCDISDSGPVMTATLLISSGSCPAIESLSIEELVAEPEKHLNRTIRLTGTLVNLGTNYFTDRRIALTDEKGNAIAVQPRLPVEAAPGNQPGPLTLAAYLDKRVEVTGKIALRTEDGGDEVLVFDVRSAEMAPPQ